MHGVDDVSYEYADIVVNSTKSLLGVVNDVLDFCALDHGIRLEYIQMDIR